MMPDIFSSFDPSSFNSIIPSMTIMFMINIIYMFLIDRNIWSMETNRTVLSLPILQSMVPEVERTYMFNINPLNQLMHQIFFMVIVLNLMGLFPYTFSITSHLLFTLSIGLPMWMLLIMSSAIKSIKATIAHLLPEGAPDWLNPFLVLIESSSIIVRPVTLSFRLAANMSAGHIVLGLIGIYAAAAWFNSLSVFLILLMLMIGYLLFEVAICMIQGYIFFLLLTLYANDHAH
uniref:ATP synthase F0 subunit 6 n=1 Tax=Enchytraeus irregularis TaxID=2867162 RepID=UPI0022FD4BE3|nr:ATP synthase F0 subunit 6 [Enchytraeus irregularis]WAS35296.1 ATP synthase F0 subunit 6 [Enchytraeus irregularis]